MIDFNFYQVVSLERKLIFLTPPKCSTYSLEEYLNRGGIKMDEPFRFPSTPFYHATLSEILFAYNIPIKSLKNYTIIQITRDPFTRFISSINHLQRLFNQKILIEDFLKFLENYRYLLPFNVSEFFYLLFNDEACKWDRYRLNQGGFNEGVKKILKDGVRFWYEQVWWNDIKAKINYFKLEDLAKDTSSLSNLLQIEILKYPHNNNNNNNNNNINSFELSNEQKNKIYYLFKNDFKYLNYGGI